MDIDTKKIREASAAISVIRCYGGFEVNLHEMCDEIDRLRAQLFEAQQAVLKEGMNANRIAGDLATASEHAAALTAEVARLREKCGETVCRKCGSVGKVFQIRIDISDQPCFHKFEKTCQKCIDNAIAALRK